MSEEGKRLRIGEVAELTGTTTRTIRYYEELGLLHAADRVPGSHRLYEQDDVERLNDVLRLKDLLGVSLADLRELAAGEAARASRRREWDRGIEDPVRRRELLDEAIGYVEHELELVRRRREEIAQLESELRARRRRLRKRLRDTERHKAGAGT
jgi:DNA-binding transcriptional MerR regulator